MSPSVAPAIRAENPFPGLRPFEEKDQRLFFGRESQVDTMIDKLAATHFLAVVGTSGSGKSSLVNCGLKPALRRGLMVSAGSSWRMVYLRPGTDPIRALAQSFVPPPGDEADPDRLFRSPKVGSFDLADVVEATLRTNRLGVVDTFDQARLDERTNLLVVADQFEELFRYRNLRTSSGVAQSTEEDSVAFVNLLLEAAASGRRIYVVMTMRSDFLGDCAQFFGLPEAINRSQYLVPRMTRDERRSAIEGPVKVAGAAMSPILLTRLLNDVGDNPDQLSILQHALNRTWACWQDEGCHGPVDLTHYIAIGTMAEALDRHAEQAYGELQGSPNLAICQKVFQAITDKGTDARGIRRPTRAAALCAIAGIQLDELTAVLAPFRDPSRSFVTPPITKTIALDSVIDISHESLMRIWNRLKGWVEDEAESASQYQRLVENAELDARLRPQGKSALMADPELSLMLDWKEKHQPNAAWGERYRPRFDSAIAFLEESRRARDQAVADEKERQRRELRRTRIVAAVMAVAFLVSVGLGILAWYQQHRAAFQERRAAEEERHTALAEAGEAEAEKNAKIQKRLTDEAVVARQDAETQRTRAVAAEELAKHERDLFVDAIKALREVQVNESVLYQKGIEAQANLDKLKAAHASPEEIAKAKALNDATVQQQDQIKVKAALQMAEVVAFLDHNHLISPSQISSLDLFEAAQVTKHSGGDKDLNPTGMFDGSAASQNHPTLFADEQREGTEHFIEWKTQKEVTLRSVGLFAAHDKIRTRRSFRTFKLYVKERGQWTPIPIIEYNPSLMYGGSWRDYDPGTVLAVCIDIPPPRGPVRGQEFRAVFVQTVSAAERFSGPRVLQLDGYANPGCKK